MKTLLLVIALNGLLALSGMATEPVASPYAPIEFLAGGTWRGHLPDAPNGAKMEIELKADWAANHQGIRFDSAFITNGKSAPYTSGLYAWHPRRKQIVFLYTDHEGSLTEGAITIENGVLVHDFTIAEHDGSTSKVQARIIPQGPDAYLNDIYQWKEGGWKKLVSVRYERVR